MATLKSDMIRVNLPEGRRDFWLTALQAHGVEIEWPPPEILEIFGGKYKRISMSALTDEQAGSSQHIARGAEYVPLDE